MDEVLVTMPVVNRGSKKWLAELKGRCTCSYMTPKPSVRQREETNTFLRIILLAQ